MYDCDAENKKLINRISRIQGQVNSVKEKLITDMEKESHQDPYEIIRQLSGIKGSLNGMINSYIEHFAKGHVVKDIRESKDEGNAIAQMDALVEIMKSYSK
ncbi:metal-sensing transcriptional repressor [Arcobacter arenosus]|jgi:DNA-binding FrmR family transcriptional regulator|uniref:metal-sensing transcriptional repressor n=1 Tax=Arcobacter arenosus TaxID=2576037 RepID=UPI003BAB5C21